MITVEELGSLYHAFELTAKRYGSRPFLRAPALSTKEYADDAIEYSYDSAKARVDELIRGYAAEDLRRGDRVAIAFDSRLQNYLHLLALNALGVSIVPLNSSATAEELGHIISHSDSRLLVSLPKYRERLAGLEICDVITEESLNTSFEQPILENVTEHSLSSEAALLYTSGTTGKPKGCILSNEYFLAIGCWYIGLGDICQLDENDRLLTPLPPNHMNALCTSFTAMLLCGGCVIQLDRFHPRTWWEMVRDEKATVIHCLGVMTAILLTLPEDESDDFSAQLKFCFGPGSDPKHQNAFEQRFGFPLIESWAMTETGAGGLTIAYKEPRHVGQRCIGMPLESMDHRIVDEKGIDLPSGEAGELLVRQKGGNPRRYFFSGYYKDETATEESWKGGWWHTGDVVREGPDGSLFFVDRRKNVIRRSGENIAAVEVEAVLLQHPDIDGCAVCAVPDKIRGDEVFAFIISNKEIEARAIFDHCMGYLTYYKVPGYIALVPELPLTASQKVSRGVIKQLARKSLANADCEDLREFKKRIKR